MTPSSVGAKQSASSRSPRHTARQPNASPFPSRKRGRAHAPAALPLARLFLRPEEAEVARGAAPLLQTVALVMPALALMMILTGALRGAGDTRTSMRWNLLAHWGVGLPVGYLLAFGVGLGITGLWIGLSAGLILAGGALLRAWARLAAAFVQGAMPALHPGPIHRDGEPGPAAHSTRDDVNAVAATPGDRPH